MPVSPRDRQAVDGWFREQMGPDLGATMMELLPPTDPSWRQRATSRSSRPISPSSAAS